MTLKKYDYIKYIHIFCKSDDKLWNQKVTAHVVACVCASDLHHILAGRPNGRTGAAGGWHWGCPADSPQYVAAQWSGRHSDWCRGHSGNKGRSAGPSGGGDTSDAVKSLPQRRCISVNEPVSRWNPSHADRLVKCCCFCFVFSHRSGCDLLQSVLALAVAGVSHDDHDHRHLFVYQRQGAVLQLSSQNALWVHVGDLLDFLPNRSTREIISNDIVFIAYLKRLLNQGSAFPFHHFNSPAPPQGRWHSGNLDPWPEETSAGTAHWRLPWSSHPAPAPA